MGSYAAKYNSAFYGPFRNIIGTKKNNKTLGVDKSTYQIPITNTNEALQEIALDINEGADSIIIKPGIIYLDILKKAQENFCIPIFGYQVSGEHAMLIEASKKNLINYENALMECMISFKRAGANGIWTYAAIEVAKIILQKQ